MAFNLKSALAKFNKNASAIKDRSKEGGIESFDDGRYQARLEKIEIDQSPNDKKRTVASYFWRFVNGDYAGKRHRSFQGWSDEEQFGYFLKDLQSLGYDIDEFEDFGTDIPKVVKDVGKEQPICQIQLKTNKDDYQNVRILKVLDPDDVDIEIDEDDDEDETPAKGKAAKKKPAKKAKADEDEEEEDDDTEDEESEDEDDEEEEEEEEEDAKPAKGKSKKPAAKPAKGKASKKKDEEEEEDDEEEEEDADEDDDESDDEDEQEELVLTVGSTVKVKTKAGVKKGTVKALDEKAQKVSVELADGKAVKLSFDAVLSVEEAPKPKASTKKKR